MARSSGKYLLGQLGGFPLRLGWFPRLIAAYKDDERIPIDPEKIACDLGIGKNMAKCLRVWSQAAGVIDPAGEFQEFAGDLLRKDEFLQRGSSIALLHWRISSNLSRFTANAWLFNYMHSNVFTIREAVGQFLSFLKADNESYAEGTIRADIETVIRMYVSINERAYDEMDDRFLYPMRLLTVRKSGGRTVIARTWAHSRTHVSPNVLMYSILQTLATRKTDSTTLFELYSSAKAYSAPGSVFGFTRDGFYIALEDLAKSNPKKFTVAALPGGELLFRVSDKRLAAACKQGDASIADKLFFAH